MNVYVAVCCRFSGRFREVKVGQFVNNKGNFMLRTWAKDDGKRVDILVRIRTIKESMVGIWVFVGDMLADK